MKMNLSRWLNTQVRRFLLVFGIAAALVVSAPRAQADTFSVRKDFFEAIDREVGFGAYEIEIDARFGKVVLSGSVASARSRVRSEEIARATHGVESVRNDLVVSETFAKQSGHSVSPLAGRVREAVLARSDLGGMELSVTSLGDKVTLEGLSSTERDRSEIEKTASAVEGVKQVENLVKVRPAMSDDSITLGVREALAANNGVSLNGLEVSTSSGIVTIRGNRPNHRERDLILSIALNVRGVKDLRSELR